MTADQVEKLVPILSTFTLNLQKFSHGLNQSCCEAFNNVLARYAPKNTYAPLVC